MPEQDSATWDARIAAAVAEVAAALRARKWTLVTAESCTGGLMAKCCTDLPGSSDWYHGGYVAYSYPAKEQQLGVIHDDLVAVGAVSEEIAAQMAIGARRKSRASIAVSATGIAGPTGGLPHKPVGLVCMGWSLHGGRIVTTSRQFAGDRSAVRAQTVLALLKGVLEQVGD